MRIRDLITEEINLLPYNKRIYDTINDAIIQAINKFVTNETKFAKFKNDVDQGNLDSMKKPFFNTVVKLLNNSLRDRLFHLSDEISNSEFVSGIFFLKISDNGKVVDANEIHLNIDFIFKISQFLFTYFKSQLQKTPGFENLFSPLNTDQKHAILAGLSDVVSTLAIVYTHEMVHIIQNIKQSHRTKPEYRSYQDNKKLKSNNQGELYQLALNKNRTKEQEARFKKLYYSSPQEIAAFANNIAQKILYDFGATLYKSRNDFRTAFRMIPFYIRDYAPAPTSPTEQKVFNRYAKLAFNAIVAYIDTNFKQTR